MFFTVVLGLAVLAAAVTGQVLQAVVLIAVGVAQPFVQELIVKNNLNGVAAQIVTWLASYGIAFVVVWGTGGLAGADPMPALNAADPSAFLTYWAVRLLPVRLAASLTYQAFQDKVKSVAGTGS